MRKRWKNYLCLLLIACAGMIAIVPEFRSIMMGLVKGEQFCQGRPVSYWIHALNERDPAVRHRAIDAIGPGVRTPEVLQALIELLDDPNSQVRMGAAMYLGGFGTDARQGVPPLTKMLQSQRGGDRVWAAYALGHIGPEARSAVPILMDLLKDDDVHVRRNAASALGGIGAEAKIALPALIEALGDENGEVQEKAADALWKIDPEAAARAKKPQGRILQ